MAATLFLLGAAVGIGAQESPLVGSPWTQWLGCWEVASGEWEGNLVCITSAGDDGVSMTTIVDGVPEGPRAYVADGIVRDWARETCTESESVTPSEDGRRMFVRTHVSCEGESGDYSGILAFIAVDEWLAIRVESGIGRRLPLVTRYRLAGPERMAQAGLAEEREEPPLHVLGARTTASMPLEVEAVTEASRHTGPEAVEALLAARGAPFDLDGTTLLALDESGVPASVIDVMVALTYPDRFNLTSVSGITPTGNDDRTVLLGRNPYLTPVFIDLWFGADSWRAQFYYGSYSTGIGHWGGYDPVVVIVDPVPRGRAVAGKGYTRGSSGAPPARPGVGPRSGRRSQTAGSSMRSSGSTSRGSSSTAIRRKAKPKGGGGP